MAGAVDLERELDGLFALPLDGFISARDALSKKLRAAGSAEEAGRVKALKKPSVPAWAVNQVVHEAPLVWRGVLKAGEKLRASPPAKLREAMQARRDALVAARRKAEEILERAGHASNPQTMHRVASTLEALATYGGAEGYPAPGRLSEELLPPGLEELAALQLLPSAAPAAEAEKSEREAQEVEAPEKPRRSKKEDGVEPAETRGGAAAAERERARREHERKSLREKAAAATRALEEWRREEKHARAAVSEAERKARVAQSEVQTLEARLEDARKRERALTKELESARARLERAERDVREAERAAEEAAAALGAR